MDDNDVRTTGDPTYQRVSVGDDGRVLAAADVDSADPGVVRAALRREVAPLPPGSGERLVDAVLDLPVTAAADRLEAAVPAAEGDMVHQFRDRTDDVQTRLAGATVLVVATPRDAGSSASAAADPSAPVDDRD